MPFSFEMFITLRYLKSGNREVFGSLTSRLSIAGIIIGVMALVAVIAVMSGAEADLKDRITKYAAHVIVMADSSYLSDYQDEAKDMAGLPGVNEASPFIYSQIFMRSTEGVTGGILKGIAEETEKRLSIPPLKEVSAQDAKTDLSGETQPDNGLPGLYLGKDTAKKLKVKKGDIIYVMRPEKEKTGFGRMPGIKRCRVLDVIESPMSDFEVSFAYARLKDAQTILGIGDVASGIELRLKDIYDADKVTNEVAVMKSNQRYWINNWMRLNRNLFSALRLQKVVMFIILSLIIFVAAFNISSTLIMTVIEKTGDIAILKAMGATNGMIRRIFVLKGFLTGFIGILTGTVLGALVCEILKRYKFIDLPRDVYFFSRLPVRMEAGDVLLISIGALVICFLGTLYPASRAVRLNPAEILRHQ